jgi:uncharacterized protein DUF5309
MTVASNTFQTFQAIGNAEDVSDLIFDISPMETPFVSSCKKTKATGTKHEWQTDTLDAPAANAHVQGDDSTNHTITPTVRLFNQCQILKKTVGVSGTQRAVKHYGRDDEFEYQLAKDMRSIKRDLEFAAVTNQASTAGSNAAGSAALMASAESWIKSNLTSCQEGTAGTTPGQVGGSPVTAPTDSTSAGSVSETILRSLVKDAWSSGGEPTILMVPGAGKEKVSGFSGIATRFLDTDKGKQAQLVSGVDIWVTNFGKLTVVPNRFMRSSVALILDMDYWAIASLRSFKVEKLAKTGDADRSHIVGEYTLECRNEKASAKASDINYAK